MSSSHPAGFGRLAAVLAALLLGLALLAPTGARASTELSFPVPMPSYRNVLALARVELGKRVRERAGDDVPRYRYGRGRIAPYSIGDQWCVAFATWVWNRAGRLDYLGTDLLWISRDGSPVAVQVRDLSRWARREGHWSSRARPGYLVAYGRSHIGIVEKADRRGRAVISIEGNKGNGVRRVLVPMERVTGYISPEPFTEVQVSLMAGQRPDL